MNGKILINTLITYYIFRASIQNTSIHILRQKQRKKYMFQLVFRYFSHIFIDLFHLQQYRKQRTATVHAPNWFFILDAKFASDFNNNKFHLFRFMTRKMYT